MLSLKFGLIWKKGLTGFELNPIIPTKNVFCFRNHYSCSVYAGVDWARLKTPSSTRISRITTRPRWPKPRNVAGAKSRRNAVKTKRSDSRKEEEERRREEEERLREEQEAELRRQEEEQRRREEAERKAAEANKKRQREEVEAGPNVLISPAAVFAAPGWSPVRVYQRWKQEADRMSTAAQHKGRSANGQRCTRPGPEKGRPRPKKSQRRRVKAEKKKRVRKAKAQDDDEVEIVGESRSGAGPSRVSLDRLVMAIEGMSDRMSELTQAHRESTEAQRESSRVSRRVARALEDLVDEAACFGASEEFSEEESEEEEVAEGELDEEMARLQEDMAENPMSPPKKLGTEEARV
ncbi:hypothetical protein BU15DRAFT_77914 [Melanogaster broomeanus]|nr:hypothetical protein BU15DRAFT_77914 [Melanogaster broomeanus]